jgi:myo-inositol-1(or 4)-monophosphatase
VLSSPHSLPLTRLLATAREAAEAASEVHRRYQGGLGKVMGRDKGHRDFVSEVDLAAQEASLEVIRSRHPLHRILAEEEDGSPSDGEGAAGEPCWIVDPLDGTTNFLHGHPMFCASVGVVLDGVPVAGAVTAAATGERWWAAHGLGAFRNGEPIRVSRVEEPGLALVGTGFPFKTPQEVPAYLHAFGRVLLNSSGVRRGGSAAMDLCYLAQGSLDAFWELTLSPWDVAGGLVILTEAGGLHTRIDGSPTDVERPGSLLAANGEGLHRALGALVRGE